jgi:hypothetical protein
VLKQLNLTQEKTMTELEYLNDAIENCLSNRNGRLHWTLEQGRGQTYSTGKPTLYAHDAYPRSSVLYGRERRRYVHGFDSIEQAMDMLKGRPIMRYLDNMMEGGTTHIDVDIVTSHLPDDTDY